MDEIWIKPAPLLFDMRSRRFRVAHDGQIAILTNGEAYQFYTDLDAPNRMDAKPSQGVEEIVLPVGPMLAD